MLRHKRAQVAAPDFPALLQVQGQHDVPLGRRPRNVDVIGVECRRGRGIAVEVVLGMGCRLEIPRPDQSAVGRPQAADDLRGVFFHRAGDE